MSAEILSTEELRRWCRAQTRRGRGKHLREYGREFSTMAFLRHIGWDNTTFYRWMDGDIPIPKERARLIRRFVEDWEAGLLEFTKSSRTRRAELVRRTTPRPIAKRYTLSIGAGGARIRFLGRPERRTMPSFPDVVGALTRGSKSCS